MSRTLLIAAAAALLMSPMLPDAAPAQGKGNRNCPPGLAKKDPPCVPPGQAKRGNTGSTGGTSGTGGTTTDDTPNPVYYVAPDGTRYYLGDRVPGTGQLIVDADTLRRLPLLEDGRAYVELDGQVVEVIEDTNTVIRALGILGDLVN